MVTVSTNYYQSNNQSTRSIYTSAAKTANGFTAGENPHSPSQYIYVPIRTRDYIIQRGAKGLGLFAKRDIMEGGEIFANSLKYTVTDVEDGDYLVFNPGKVIKKSNIPAKQAYNVVPPSIALEADLIFTHGTLVLSDDPEKKSSGIISYHVKVPSMLMNHSCDPNIIHDGGKDGHERHLATRCIAEGEELTTDYSLIYYDEGPVRHKCLCESSNCTGMVKGFKNLEADAQQKLMPIASPAVRALFMADLKLEKPVRYEQPLVAEREIQAPLFSSSEGFRMVCPPPSHRQSDIGVVVKDDDSYGLYALRNFDEGDIVYTFWVDDWPTNGKLPVEMVFGTAIGEGDPVEGTSFWMNPAVCGYKNARGKVTFSGFNMLAQHSCDPNIVYKQTKVTDRERWQHAYAARDITRGEDLTVDLNMIFWDRPGVKIATCSCESDKCAGTVKGFKYLSVIRQKKRWVDSDNGRHLSPFIREQCRRRDTYYHEYVCNYDSDSYKTGDIATEVRDDQTRPFARESSQSGGHRPGLGSVEHLSGRVSPREQITHSQPQPRSRRESPNNSITGRSFGTSISSPRASFHDSDMSSFDESESSSLRDNVSEMGSSLRSMESAAPSSRRGSSLWDPFNAIGSELPPSKGGSRRNLYKGK